MNKQNYTRTPTKPKTDNQIEIATLELVGSRSYPTTLEICRALQKAGFRKQNKQTIKAMIKQKYIYKDKSYLALTIKGKKTIK